MELSSILDTLFVAKRPIPTNPTRTMNPYISSPVLLTAHKMMPRSLGLTPYIASTADKIVFGGWWSLLQTPKFQQVGPVRRVDKVLLSWVDGSNERPRAVCIRKPKKYGTSNSSTPEFAYMYFRYHRINSGSLHTPS